MSSKKKPEINEISIEKEEGSDYEDQKNVGVDFERRRCQSTVKIETVKLTKEAVDDLLVKFNNVMDIVNVEREIIWELLLNNRTNAYERKLDIIREVTRHLKMMEIFIREQSVEGCWHLLSNIKYKETYRVENFEKCFFITKKINTKKTIIKKKKNLKGCWVDFIKSLMDWSIKIGYLT